MEHAYLYKFHSLNRRSKHGPNVMDQCCTKNNTMNIQYYSIGMQNITFDRLVTLKMTNQGETEYNSLNGGYINV